VSLVLFEKILEFYITHNSRATTLGI